MTLDTRVAIGAPTDVHALFQFCRELLSTPATTPIQQYTDTAAGTKSLSNPMGIGLPALLELDYGPDGPLPVHAHDEWCDDDCDTWVAQNPVENGWAAVVVSFDTTYSYRGPHGETCSNLHAQLVFQVGRWCDQRHLPWKWQNEFTGEWFDGMDGLDEFSDAFRDMGAQAWFTGSALPAILAVTGGAQ